jgi:membrane protein implicated in regulation of membrane protease activity
MSGWSPPSVPRNWLLVAAVLYAFVLAYSLLIAQQVLLAVFLGLFVASIYLFWRVLRAFEAIADAQQRRAAAAERESRPTTDPDEDTRF